jgi:hypothetical protein
MAMAPVPNRAAACAAPRRRGSTIQADPACGDLDVILPTSVTTGTIDVRAL